MAQSATAHLFFTLKPCSESGDDTTAKILDKCRVEALLVGLNLGAERYCSKPVNIAELMGHRLLAIETNWPNCHCMTSFGA